MNWNDCQQDLAKTAFTLVKYNNGFWKSYKQREFIKKQMGMYYFVHTNAAETQNNFGIELLDGQFAWCLEGSIRFADYGYRSYRRVGIMFVCDDFGIVEQYKLHYSYSSDGRSSCVNTSKTECVWMRDEEQEKPVFEAPVVTQPSSKFLGMIGDWLETEVTIISIRAVGVGAYGTTYQTKMQDKEGNQILYWGIMKNSQENTTVHLRAKVKALNEYKGVNQTVVGYAKIK